MQRFRLPRTSELMATTRSDLFDGVVTLTADAIAVQDQDWSSLYRTEPPQEGREKLTALPYFLWANRGQGSMVVWVPET